MKFKLGKLENLIPLSEGWQARCPACAAKDEDKNGKNHLKIYKNGAFNCAKYGSDKNHNRYIRKFLVDSQLDGEFIDVEYIDPEPKLELEKVYPESMLSKLLKDYSYWEGRNISIDTLSKIGGGVAPKDEKNKMSGRYIFPIRNNVGQIVGFSGRLIYENSMAPKWKHLFKSSKVCWPFGITKPYIQKSKTVVLVESIGDFLILADNDIWNTLVLFGLNLNSKVMFALVSTGVTKIIISTNNDEGEWGKRGAMKAKKTLDKYFDENNVIIRLPDSGNDWGEATKEEINQFKKEIDEKT